MTGYRRIGVFLAVAGLSATAGAALWDRHRPIPAETRVMLSACGLVPAPEAVSLPLESLFAGDAPGLAAGLALGPIRHPGLDAPLWVRFEVRDAPEDVEEPLRSPALRPRMEEGVLVIPVARDRTPETIRLGCRHGHVAEVRHQHAGTWHHLPVTPDPQAAPARSPATGTDSGAAREGTSDANRGADLRRDRDTGPAGGARPDRGLRDHAATLAVD